FAEGYWACTLRRVFWPACFGLMILALGAVPLSVGIFASPLGGPGLAGVCVVAPLFQLPILVPPGYDAPPPGPGARAASRVARSQGRSRVRPCVDGGGQDLRRRRRSALDPLARSRAGHGLDHAALFSRSCNHARRDLPSPRRPFRAGTGYRSGHRRLADAAA